ncbi:hypothetical protein [Bradyrhizobium sp.]|uniref:hypothetical protein n=1 Tax=Bradyrhizobium sp. TaxID=376 RepID=UPI003459F441|nr:hypothetical protein [Bradyrhizobium sp.]
MKGHDEIRGRGREACKRIGRAEPEHLVPNEEFSEVQRDEIRHQLVGLVPMSDLCDPILRNGLCFRCLRRNLAGGQIGSYLAFNISGFEFGLVR